MAKHEIGRLKKGKASLIEYGEGTFNHSDNYFIQVGVVGLYCTKKELEDLFTVLNCYINMENISECKVTMQESGEEYGWMAL
jgi:hypothetical protein